jgi:superfamily II DNA or RNA helicase
METDIIKDELQQTVHQIFINKKCWGTIVAATGTGKSRLFILEVERLVNAGLLTEEDKALLVVPTTTLRDENWPREFRDAGREELLKYVEIICYASAHKTKSTTYYFVCLDEIHNLTRLSAQLFKDEKALKLFVEGMTPKSIMGLTATMPDIKQEESKYQLIQSIAPVIFQYNLEDALNDGLVADFTLYVVRLDLDYKEKYIKGGTKKQPMVLTELSQYNYLTKAIKRHSIKGNYHYVKLLGLNRARMLSDTVAKNRALKHLMSKYEDKRTLLFFGSVEHSERIMGKEHCYNYKSVRTTLQAFKNKEINRLGVIKAVNEGENIQDLDLGIIVYNDANARGLVQRLGRMLRKREGYKALIFMLVMRGTVEEDNLKNNLPHLPRKNIQFISELELMKLEI